MSDTGILTVHAATTPELADQLIDVVTEQINRFAEEGPNDVEIEITHCGICHRTGYTTLMVLSSRRKPESTYPKAVRETQAGHKLQPGF